MSGVSDLVLISRRTYEHVHHVMPIENRHTTHVTHTEQGA